MAFFYLDASAIAKLYLPNEQGVEFVVQLLDLRSSTDMFATSALSVVEVKSAITRRIGSPSDKAPLLAAYDRDLREIFDLISIRDDIIIGASSVAERYGLRAGDAIHLATALDIAATADETQVFMVSSDTELLEASDVAGIGALDPQTDDAVSSLLELRGH